MADQANITSNVIDGNPINSDITEGVTVQTNVLENTNVQANVVTGGRGENGVGVPAGGTTGQVLAKASGTDYDDEWVDQSGGGAVDSVNAQTGVVVLDTDDISDTGATNKYVTAAEKTKLSNLSGTNTGDQDLSGYGLKSGKLSQFAATTSAELAGVISNETGSGLLVFGTSPNITTPTGIVKGDVGLGNVDNTSDATKNAASVTLTNKTITDPILSQTASPTYTRGKLVYDTDNESLTFYNDDSNVALQVGQEEWIRVKNVTGSTIANGAAIYISGSNAGLPTIAPAQSNSATTTICAGLTTESIPNNATGYVTCIGVVRGIDTSAFVAGATVFVSSTVAGGLVSTAPTAPNYRYRVGIVAVSNASTGTIHVTPSTAALGNGTANQLFGINSAGTAQEVKTLQGTTNDITVTHGANTITLATGSNIYKSGGTDVTVADGGTGRSTATTAYGLIAAGTTATGVQQTISPGTAGHVLTSNGASALATFQAPSGGANIVKSIALTAHGFSVGNLVRYNGTTYVLAKADAAANADVEGIVTTVTDANNFIITLDGYITGLSGFTAGTDYFLSESTAGLLTSTAPSSVGQVNYFLFKSDSTTSGYFRNHRGTVVVSGGGGGDVSSNTATSVDSEIALFSSTTGKIIKRATGTGIATLTSGVLSATATNGSGNVVLTTTPTLVTPVLGVATATSINKVTITAPATGSTLTIPDGVTLTGPAASGTAMTLGNAETVTGVKTFGTIGGAVGKFILAGSTSGSTIVNAAATAGSTTLTLPAATDTLVGKATTDTLTNKTFNTAGTGNVFQINGTGITAVNGTGAVTLTTSPAFVTPALGVATATSINKVTITAPTTSATLTIPDGVTLTGPAASGTAMTLGNAETVTGAKTFGVAGNVGKLIVAGTTSGTTILNATAVAGSTTLTLPAATDTLVGKATTDVFTNKDLTSTTNIFPNGSLVQAVNATFSAVAIGTTIIPFDDTIPQITEGDEYMTVSITPKSTTNILVIQAVFMGSHSASGEFILGLFQGATANALAADSFFSLTATGRFTIPLTYTMAAGTTSATTFRIRAGSESAGTTTFNGVGGARRFGAIPKSSIVIWEYKA